MTRRPVPHSGTTDPRSRAFVATGDQICPRCDHLRIHDPRTEDGNGGCRYRFGEEAHADRMRGGTCGCDWPDRMTGDEPGTIYLASALNARDGVSAGVVGGFVRLVASRSGAGSAQIAIDLGPDDAARLLGWLHDVCGRPTIVHPDERADPPDPLAVACPSCGGGPGDPCRALTPDDPRGSFHSRRVREARRRAAVRP